MASTILESWNDPDWRSPIQRKEMKCFYKKVYHLLWHGIRRMKQSVSTWEDFSKEVYALYTRIPPPEHLQFAAIGAAKPKRAVVVADPKQAAAFSGPEHVATAPDQVAADPIQVVADPDDVVAILLEPEEAMASAEQGPIRDEDEMWESLEDIMEDARAIEISKNKYTYEACMHNK